MYCAKPAVLFHLVDVQSLGIHVVQLPNLFCAIIQFPLVVT